MNACRICGSTGRLVYDQRQREWFCLRQDAIECVYRARLRLGVSPGRARALRAAEWTAVIAARKAANRGA